MANNSVNMLLHWTECNPYNRANMRETVVKAIVCMSTDDWRKGALISSSMD